MQGAGIAAGGLIAQTTGTVTGTIALAGAVGVLCATAVAMAWSRIDPADLTAPEG